MRTVDIRDAEAQLSKLIEAVAQGEKFVIAIASIPAAMLLPIQDRKPVRKPGAMKGKIQIAADFDATVPDVLQAAFEGR
jgi:antitoxin (DNA-binding transcriptional repressor) of toxin-antitoxin stability system